MSNGLYSAATAMMMASRKHDILARNILASNFNGGKAENPVVNSFQGLLEEHFQNQIGNQFVYQNENEDINVRTQIDFSQGDIVATENPMDVAINGKGFLRLETQNGFAYTRSGVVKRDAEGYLVINGGFKILGQGGPIQVNEAIPGEISILEDGTINKGNQTIGKIDIYDFEDKSVLRKAYENVFYVEGDAQPTTVSQEEGQIGQGFLEKSNIDKRMAFMDMMLTLRNYQAAHKIVTLQDQLIKKSIDSII